MTKKLKAYFDEAKELGGFVAELRMVLLSKGITRKEAENSQFSMEKEAKLKIALAELKKELAELKKDVGRL